MIGPRLIVLRVGQGDSMLLVGSGAGAVIIDVPRPQQVEKRLIELSENDISAIYVTHAHRDHVAPFAQLLRFLLDWLKRGRVERVHLPAGIYQAAWQRCKRLLNASDPEGQRLRAILDSIDELSRNATIQISSITAESGPIRYGSARVIPIHPRHLFVEKQRGLGFSEDNALSLVLRVEFGASTALLLADIDGIGLEELSTVDAAMLSAHVVKIPHHGAWPDNASLLKAVLSKANPEVAIVSVGSRNPYTHVRPELFSYLLELRAQGRLREFRCTEVTRTCVFDSAARKAMGTAGLPEARICAGEMQLVPRESGGFDVSTETDHPAIVANVEMPACQGKADLAVL